MSNVGQALIFYGIEDDGIHYLAHEANISVMNTAKSMANKALSLAQ